VNPEVMGKFACMWMRWVTGVLVLLLLGGAVWRFDSSSDASHSYLSEKSKYHAFSAASKDKINSFFRRMHQAGLFNGTYLFFKGDSLLQGKHGFANFRTGDTLLIDDLFQLASVSKTITGTAVMSLYQDGLLNLDDSVHHYLRDLKRKNLTIRQLLSHTSGLPDYFDFSDRYWPDKSRHMNNNDVIQMLNKLPATMFARPGAFYNYCNTNYVLLSAIVEKVSHHSFRHFVKHRVFEPSGMPYSHINNFDSIPLSGYFLQGFERSHYLVQDVPQNGTCGDKGVYSNTWEMFLFDRALRSPFLLHRSILEEMYRPAVPTSNQGQFYALGWRVTWINMRKWAFHNGWWKGFRTYFWRCLDDNRCYVVLTNNVNGRFLSTREMVSLLD
jgi:CubicO group peptidase (beta-lactamase class C family)